MSKGTVALAGLLALSLAASPGKAGQDAREVRVRLLADEEARAKAGWPDGVAGPINVPRAARVFSIRGR